MSQQNLDNFMDYIYDTEVFENTDSHIVVAARARELRDGLNAEGQKLGDNLYSSHTLNHVSQYISDKELANTVLSLTSRAPKEDVDFADRYLPNDIIKTVFPDERTQWSQFIEVLGVLNDNKDFKEAINNYSTFEDFMHDDNKDEMVLSLRKSYIKNEEHSCESHGFISLDGFIHPLTTDQCCTAVLRKDPDNEMGFGFGVQTIYPGLEKDVSPAKAAEHMNVRNEDLTPLVKQTKIYKEASLEERIRLSTSARTDLFYRKGDFDPKVLSEKPRTVLERKCHIDKDQPDLGFAIRNFYKNDSEMRITVTSNGIIAKGYKKDVPIPLLTKDNGEKVYKVEFSDRNEDVKAFSKKFPSTYRTICEVDKIISAEKSIMRQQNIEQKEKIIADVRNSEVYKDANVLERARMTLDKTSYLLSKNVTVDREVRGTGYGSRFSVYKDCKDGSCLKMFVSENQVTMNRYNAKGEVIPLLAGDGDKKELTYIGPGTPDADVYRFKQVYPEEYQLFHDVKEIVDFEVNRDIDAFSDFDEMFEKHFGKYFEIGKEIEKTPEPEIAPEL